MKLSMLLLPVLAIAFVGCGQLAPSKKNGYTKSSSIIAGCAALQVHNASGVEANILSGLSACATASTTGVVIKYNLMVSNYKLCVYPANGAAISSAQAQCFYPNSFVGEQSLNFSTAFNSVAIVEETNRSAFEMSGLSNTIQAPYASVQFR